MEIKSAWVQKAHDGPGAVFAEAQLVDAFARGAARLKHATDQLWTLRDDRQRAQQPAVSCTELHSHISKWVTNRVIPFAWNVWNEFAWELLLMKMESSRERTVIRINELWAFNQFHSPWKPEMCAINLEPTKWRFQIKDKIQRTVNSKRFRLT